MLMMYEWMVSGIAALGGFAFGYEIGVISQVLEINEFGATFGYMNLLHGEYVGSNNKDDVTGWITSVFLIGCAFGCLVLSYTADSLGRKVSLCIGSALFTTGGLVQTFSPVLWVLYVGRFVSGLGVGILASAVPLYISEIAPKQRRGTLLALEQLNIGLGIFVASATNSLIIYLTVGNLVWRLALGMQAIVGIILFGLVCLLPRSPRWLVSCGRKEEALEILSRVRNVPLTNLGLIEEFDEIVASIEAEKGLGSVQLTELWHPNLRSRLGIAIALQIFQQFTGVNAIFYYQATIIQDMGFSKSVALGVVTMVNNAFNFLAVIPGLYLIEHIGRRPLLIFGGIGMGFGYCAIALFIKLSATGISTYAWLAIVSVYIFFLSFDSTWGPVPWAYVAEIFPYRVRAKAIALTTILNWLANAIVAKTTPLLLDAIDIYLYVIFGIICLVMAAFTYFLIPETRRVSLENMDSVFVTSTPSVQDSEKNASEKTLIE